MNLHDRQKYMVALHLDISLDMDNEKYKRLVYDLLAILPEAAR